MTANPQSEAASAELVEALRERLEEGGMASCMSLRDHFAAQAIGAVCDRLSSPGPLADVVAADAYAIADAMLAERKRVR